MAEFLALENDQEYLEQKDKEGRVDFLRNFSPDRFFCMIGTNRADYNAAAGLYGKDASGATVACPRAYAYRSHSGFFGIVNSEATP